MTDIPLFQGAQSLGDYVKAARPHVASLLSKGGSFLGGAARASVGGTPGMAAQSAYSAYPYVKDSNFPGVAESRARRGNPFAQAAQQFAGGTGMTPQDRINEGFNSFDGLTASDRVGERYAALLDQERQQPQATPAAPASVPAADGYYGGSPETNPNLQPYGERDTTSLYAGSPETNPNLRPMGNPLPWQGSPFSGFLDAMHERGAKSGAGLIPKFVNLIGRNA